MIHAHDARTPSASLAAAVGIALVGALLAGCSIEDGSNGGDAPVKPPANEYGSGVHISSTLGGFFGPAPWVQLANINSTGCPYPPTTPVVTTGVTVTVVDTFDETGNGAIGSVYVQDTLPGKPTPIYGGTSLFQPSFTPPDLRVLPGDVLDLNGVYEEFIGPSTGYFSQCQTLPQIAGAATFRFDGAVPTPVTITPDDLNSYASARRYLNMLVKVTNVSVAAAPTTSSGRYSAAVSVSSGANFSISNELFDLGTQMPLSQGAAFKSVTGIVTYFYNFQLAPRSVADFEM